MRSRRSGSWRRWSALRPPAARSTGENFYCERVRASAAESSAGRRRPGPHARRELLHLGGPRWTRRATHRSLRIRNTAAMRSAARFLRARSTWCSSSSRHGTSAHLVERVIPQVPVCPWSCRCSAGCAQLRPGSVSESRFPFGSSGGRAQSSLEGMACDLTPSKISRAFPRRSTTWTLRPQHFASAKDLAKRQGLSTSASIKAVLSQGRFPRASTPILERRNLSSS